MPLLIPVKTLVKDVPSFETDITKLTVLSFPLYQAILTLQMALSLLKSTVIDDPMPKSDHLVLRLPSIALVAGLPAWLPLAVMPEIAKMLQEAAVAMNGGVDFT